MLLRVQQVAAHLLCFQRSGSLYWDWIHKMRPSLQLRSCSEGEDCEHLLVASWWSLRGFWRPSTQDWHWRGHWLWGIFNYLVLTNRINIFITHLANYQLLASTHLPQPVSMVAAFSRSQEHQQGVPPVQYQLLVAATSVFGMEWRDRWVKDSAIRGIIGSKVSLLIVEKRQRSANLSCKSHENGTESPCFYILRTNSYPYFQTWEQPLVKYEFGDTKSTWGWLVSSGYNTEFGFVHLVHVITTNCRHKMSPLCSAVTNLTYGTQVHPNPIIT